jgi:hypothetical protein
MAGTAAAVASAAVSSSLVIDGDFMPSLPVKHRPHSTSTQGVRTARLQTPKLSGRI